jgi:cytochrome c biogenesis protein
MEQFSTDKAISENEKSDQINSNVSTLKNKRSSTNQYALVFDHFKNTFLLYDSQGIFLGIKNIGEIINNEFCVIDIIPSTGLLVKYDPSIPLIYSGFGLLMITSSLSFLPYTQLWVLKAQNEKKLVEKNQDDWFWLGGSTNRGKIQLEIEFENLVRLSENYVVNSDFSLSN